MTVLKPDSFGFDSKLRLIMSISANKDRVLKQMARP